MSDDKQPMRGPSVPGRQVEGPADLVVRMGESTSEDWDMVPLPARQQLGWHERYEGGTEKPELHEVLGKQGGAEMLHSRELSGADQDVSLNLTQPVTYHLEATPPPAEPAGAPGSDGYNRLNRGVAPAEGFEFPGDYTLEQGAGVRTFRLPEGVGLDSDEQAAVDGTGPYAPGQPLLHADPRNQSDDTRQRSVQTPSVNDPYRNADGSLKNPEEVQGLAPALPEEFGSKVQLAEEEDTTPVAASEVEGAQASGDGVPEGNIGEVLDWVGNDKSKARQALEAEQAKGDGARKSLVAQLNDRV